jgi:stress-induced morphogen
MTYISFGKAKAPHAATLLYHRSTNPNPNGDETHLRVQVESRQFANKSLIQRHRMVRLLHSLRLYPHPKCIHVQEPQHARSQVHQLLREELGSGLHALSLVTKTPEEVGEEEDAVTGVAE